MKLLNSHLHYSGLQSAHLLAEVKKKKKKGLGFSLVLSLQSTDILVSQLCREGQARLRGTGVWQLQSLTCAQVCLRHCVFSASP